MKVNNQFLFLGCEALMFKIWSQVISPPESATLPTSPKSWRSINIYIYMLKCDDNPLIHIKNNKLQLTQIISEFFWNYRLTCFFRNTSPVTGSMFGYIGKYLCIFFSSPWTLFHIQLVTTRRSHHFILICKFINNDHIYNLKPNITKFINIKLKNPKNEKEKTWDRRESITVKILFEVLSCKWELRWVRKGWYEFKGMRSVEARKAWVFAI